MQTSVQAAVALEFTVLKTGKGSLKVIAQMNASVNRLLAKYIASRGIISIIFLSTFQGAVHVFASLVTWVESRDEMISSQHGKFGILCLLSLFTIFSTYHLTHLWWMNPSEER